MSFTKITTEDLADKGVVGLADTPNLSVTALQKKFDEIATDVIVPKFNNLIDELDTFEGDVDITQRVKSEEITNIRTDDDENLQISRDNGKTWSATASSGHIIEDGNGTAYPSRGRMQFSSNVNIFDEPADNRTFIQVQSGEKGDKGDDSTITVGNVYESTVPEVTNVGSPSNAIFDFGLPKGNDGSAATIQVGTVTQGTSASVSNRGTSSNAIFDFVLPKGDKGDAGTSFQVRGMFPTYADLIAAHPTGNKGDAYAVGDSVNNTIYNWDLDQKLWVDLGGIKGVKGDPGDAATVTVGTVETLDPTASAYARNDGTTENAIISFGIPKGEKGDIGTAATIAIGNVTKGDTPTVTNVGTPTNAIFDMVLPKGDKGDPTTVNGKGGTDIQLNGADILLTGYKAGQTGNVDASDSINVAISKLATSGGGAKIIVSTDDTSIGNTLTCTKGDVVISAIVPSTCEVTFSVSDTGTWTIENAESGRSVEVEVPYFGVYRTALAWGDIIITINYASDYIGATFTVNPGAKTFVADGSLTKTFVFADYGTYTVSNSLDTKTKSVNASEGGTYTVEFTVDAYSYQEWLNSASITKSFSSLEDVLADEKTVRILMTKHSSVDYLKEWLDNDDTLSDILLTSDTALKWIGLRDYAYDNMPSDFVSAWLSGDKWELALKDKVPTMTSDSAPYGTVSYSSQGNATSVAGFRAFDDSSNYWSTVQGQGANSYIGYKFANPIKLKRAILDRSMIAQGDCTYKLKASNDGTNWSELSSGSIGLEKKVIDVDNDNYYLYYRFEFPTVTSSWANGKAQFYGRSLSVSVPTMTSNTSPYGVASASSENNTNTLAYCAFNNSTSTFWASATSVKNAWVQYDFGYSVMLKKVDLYCVDGYVQSYTLLGSNDGNVWNELSSGAYSSRLIIDINSNNAYRYYRVNVVTTSANNVAVYLINFFGLDYSEHAERHWIYDNGVEVEEITDYKSGSGKVTHNANSILLEAGTSSAEGKTCVASVRTTNTMDYSKFKLFRISIARMIEQAHLINLSTTTMQYDGSTWTKGVLTLDPRNNSDFPNNISLDISAINENLYPYCACGYGSSRNIEIKEWWLE